MSIEAGHLNDEKLNKSNFINKVRNLVSSLKVVDGETNIWNDNEMHPAHSVRINSWLSLNESYSKEDGIDLMFWVMLKPEDKEKIELYKELGNRIKTRFDASVYFGSNNDHFMVIKDVENEFTSLLAELNEFIVSLGDDYKNFIVK